MGSAQAQGVGSASTDSSVPAGDPLHAAPDIPSQAGQLGPENVYGNQGKGIAM